MTTRTGTSLRNVLLATDLQADSRAVLDVAGAVATTSGSAVHLYHVLEDAAAPGGAARATLLEQRSADARRALDVQAERLKELGAEVGSVAHAKGGPAHGKILARAERMEADLIVLGSHARGGSGNRLGSTADRVLRTSPVPCLIVRGEVRLPFRQVGALVDFSRVAREAVRLAVDWLPVLGAAGKAPSLELVHVGDAHLRALDPAEIDSLLTRELDDEREAARERGGKGLDVSTRILWGRYPAEEVAGAAAGEGGYDLLVVGTHGKGPLVRALIGSVALALAQGAPCPVLIVPPKS